MSIISIFTYLMATLTALVCLIQYKTVTGDNFLKFPFITFLSVFLHSFFGTIRECFGLINLDNYTVKRLYFLTSYIEIAVALPCITSEILLQYNVGKEIAYGFAAMGILPALVFIIKGFFKDELTDLSVFLNAPTLAVVGLANGNTSAFYASIFFVAAYVLFPQGEECTRLPCLDYYNVTITGFLIFALDALKGKPVLL